MISLVRGAGRLLGTTLALASGIWLISGSSALAYGDEPEDTGHHGLLHHNNGAESYGTLGYGPPGLHPGYQGFGLSFHLGYGYGGSALGVGAEGGYPFYGGPGYPHTWPQLNRFCGITPFPYYGGPEFGYTNVGPINSYGPGYPNDGGFGPFTGPAPYPEAYFAPYTAAAATTGSASGAPPYDPFRSTPDASPDSRFVPPGTPPPTPGNQPPTPGTPPPAPGEAPGTLPRVSRIGIEPDTVVDADGSLALKVASVIPGTLADEAGLESGDVIRSINGYRTEQPGNLRWIIAHATPNNALSMTVRKVGDGKEHAVTLQLPAGPVNISRPAYLPPVGNGPPPATR